MKKISLLLALFIVHYSLFIVQAQNPEIDSLENLLQKHQEKDTIRVNLLNEIAYKLYSININRTLKYAEEAGELADKLSFTKGKAESLKNIGIIYKSQGNYSKGLEYYQKALKINEEIRNKSGISRCLNNIGVIFYEMQDYEKALEYYQKSLKIAEELKQKSSISSELNNIALIYEKQNKLDQALDYYDRCITIGEEINYAHILGWAYNGKGIVFMKQQKYGEALEFFLKGLKKRESINANKGIAQSCNSIGNLYIKTKQYEKAKEYLLRGYKIADEIDNPLNLKDAAEGLATVYEQAGQYKKSLEYFKLFKQMSDSIFNEENIKKTTGLEYEKEKQAAELEQQRKDAVHAEEVKQQKIVRNSFIAGFVLMLMLILVVLRSFIQKRKANRILSAQKEEIEEINAELQSMNEEVQTQAEQLENTNHELEKLSIVASKTDNAVSIMDAQGNFEWINEGFTQMYDLTFDEFIVKRGKNILECSKDLEINKKLATCISEKITVNYEFLFTKESNESIWVQTTITPIINDKGTLSKLIAIDSDITELKKAEAAIETKKQEIEKSYQNVQLLSQIGQQIIANLSVEKIIITTYKNVSDLMETPIFSIGIHNPEKKCLDFFGIEKLDGDILKSSDLLETKNLLSVWCFKNQKEILLNNYSKEYKKYVSDKLFYKKNAIHESLIYLPLTTKGKKIGVITIQNPQKNAFTDYHLNILKNIAVYTSIALENADAFNCIELQKEEIFSQSEELQAVNDRLLELDKYKEELTTMIIHDLKNPLNAIIGLSENDIVKQSGKQMLNMIMNILDVNKFENTEIKIQTSNTSVYELSKLALSQVDLLYHQKSIKLINRIQNYYVDIDPEIIERVFINLLTNAIKYTPNNGTITLESEEYIPGFIRVKVTDTGQGIPKEKLHTVFGKFEQVIARKSGLGRSTGIGLTFCKLFVEAHGGEINVESEENQGSTFWFTLPAGRQGNKEIKIEEEIIEEKSIELTSTEKEILKPFLLRLQELEVYESTEVEKVIEQIDCSKTKNLQKWKAEIVNAMEALNEEKYKRLIHLID